MMHMMLGPMSGASGTTTTTIQSLYSFTDATFTPGTQTGRFGPSTATAVSGLTGTGVDSWKNNTSYFDTSSGIQLWTVPLTGTYRIEVWGAQGGGGSYSGGFGARMRGDFTLTRGDVIKILVGQTGGPGSTYGGGGGMTAVATISNVPLIVAGGGNTLSAWSSTLSHAVTTTSGLAGSGGAAGGTNGNGGGTGPSGTCDGGAGFFGNGTGNGYNGTPPQSFVNGGNGNVNGCSNAIGGFGGGSASDGCVYGGSGAGGGYSGGGGTNSSSQRGGGGGSYNIGENQSNDNGNTGTATLAGNGKATITLIAAAGAVAGSGGSGSYQTLTFTASGNLTVTGNGTNTVSIFRTSGAGWDAHAYTTTGFTAPCTLEFNKQAGATDNGVSYAMIGWNADPTTDTSYTSLDYTSYPYRTGVYEVYNNGTQVLASGTWSTANKFYIVYGTDGLIRHYNGSTLLYTSPSYGTGTVYVDSSIYSTDATFGGFSNIRVINSAWNGTSY